MKTVYVSIGNSDDKLTQQEWATFQVETNQVIQEGSYQVHGTWVSLPYDLWQNACWCFEVTTTASGSKSLQEVLLRGKLRDLADKYNQRWIAWAEAITEEIKP